MKEKLVKNHDTIAFLIADDDPTNLEIVGNYVKKLNFPHYVSFKAVDGQEALEIFKLHNNKES
jgi:CheY-like chemotaxis protein